MPMNDPLNDAIKESATELRKMCLELKQLKLAKERHKRTMKRIRIASWLVTVLLFLLTIGYVTKWTFTLTKPQSGVTTWEK